MPQTSSRKISKARKLALHRWFEKAWWQACLYGPREIRMIRPCTRRHREVMRGIREGRIVNVCHGWPPYYSDEEGRPSARE